MKSKETTNYLPCTGATIITFFYANQPLTGITIEFSRSYVSVIGVVVSQGVSIEIVFFSTNWLFQYHSFWWFSQYFLMRFQVVYILALDDVKLCCVWSLLILTH